METSSEYSTDLYAQVEGRIYGERLEALMYVSRLVADTCGELVSRVLNALALIDFNPLAERKGNGM